MNILCVYGRSLSSNSNENETLQKSHSDIYIRKIPLQCAILVERSAVRLDRSESPLSSGAICSLWWDSCVAEP